MTAIYRYEVPVDDRPHAFRLFGRIVHVATRRHDAVEFWAEHSEDGHEGAERTFAVAGTGHTWPAGARYVGTAVVPPLVAFGSQFNSGLVWHLIELHPPT